MNILKITLVGAVALMSRGAMSQTFGVGAGVNYSSVNFSADDGSDFYDGYKSIIGFNAGGFYDLDFSDKIGMRFGLKYSGRGYKYKQSSSETMIVGPTTITYTTETDIDTRFNYIQINPMFKYKTEGVGIDDVFYGMVGPYISVGISGTQKGENVQTIDDGTGPVTETYIYDEKIDFGDDIDLLDMGLTAAMGMEIGSYFIEASYDFGLNNIDTNDTDDRVTNRNISLTLGYMFGK